jgi:tetratricopeptide (TPR) repeat protein
MGIDHHAAYIVIIFLLMPVFNVSAKEGCSSIVGKITSVEGEVEVRPDTNGGWRNASLGYSLCEADTIQVGQRSRAGIQLINHTVIRLDENTTLRLVNVSDDSEEWAWLDLGSGAIHSFSRSPWRVKVNLPFLKALIKGTEYYASAEPDHSELAVLEGQVEVESGQGRAEVNPGYKAIAQAGTSPDLQLAIGPRDAVQWALYYPPVLSVLDGSSPQIIANLSVPLREALELAAQGQITNALKRLEPVSQEKRDANFYLYRAAMMLSVGRVNESKADIAELSRQDPKEGLAYALLAIIELVQNNKEQALAQAEKSVSLNSTVEARIALSYVLQAYFRLEEARDILVEATKESKDNHLAWARLGELQLMLGNRQQALVAANRASALSPRSARAQVVLGYCALTEYRNNDAKSAFVQAIRLASSEPLGHLGLGLAKISNGELAEGRREIETAVALDSNSSLLRSYLGKAYFTEKRTKLDATQYNIAKNLDPFDPTAYLYDGIRKQAENKPVEALRDLQTSKELNDNRAVYRSRFLLDKDRASRGVSLARVYKDLGFLTLGQREASLSLEGDPANASAHRFLSDSYQGVRRREISRVSELLQAQLLQDVNVNPIQPSLAETNLNIFTQGGPATPGFNEFTPLYERNTAKLDVNAFGGSNNTFGGEGAVTALYNRFSFGAGGLHYQSDGWRANNGLNQHLYDFFAQAAVTPELNVQAEFRHRESKEGDLAFNFDPGTFLREKSVGREQDTARFGLRYSPASDSHFLFSYLHTDRIQKDNINGIPGENPTTKISQISEGRDDGDQFEGQYLFQRERLNNTAGFAHSTVNRQ